MKNRRLAFLVAVPVFCAAAFVCSDFGKNVMVRHEAYESIKNVMVRHESSESINISEKLPDIEYVESNEQSDDFTVAMERAFAANETDGITGIVEAPATSEQSQIASSQAVSASTSPEQTTSEQTTQTAPTSEQTTQTPPTTEQATTAPTTDETAATATAATANVVWASIGHEDIMLYPVEEDANNTNAQVACSYINGYVVKPGETFSYATTIGQGTPPERGYVIAHVIGGYDYGGGVCKISSALYHAAMNAGCAIIERHNHTQPVDYYAPGDDAAIAYKSKKDFRFRNDFGYDIMIQASYDDTGYHLDILAPQI